ncbi:MAG: hypothetical protein M0025_09330 [Elusimicrobia bacterium]|nr:hypothetical protein [Elusimicrobiota bacterium]
MKNKLGTAAAAAMLAIGLASAAGADSRTYAWTYDYTTAPAGMAEIEYYSTSKVPDTSAPAVNSWEHQLELEYGLTKRTDMALYQMFRQDGTAAGSTFSYEGMKLRLRHRLADKGALPLDTLFYLEYSRGANLAKSEELEGKLVLGKDFGRLNLTYNQVEEMKLDGKSDLEHGYSAGAAWALSDRFSAGLESSGSYSEREYYFGPTLHFQEQSMKFFANLGFLKGLNSRSDDARTRLLIGVPF